ncbi:MAG TPA: hypothetical protein VMD28_06350 [Acidimicrobiales bacterium]|nr:hypothetical protein [Acidimicrobiales bacterium]
MGALPGGSILSEPGAAGISEDFDVEAFRRAGRKVVLREVERPMVVLGSTQRAAAVNAVRAAREGVSIARRRSGGGAVLLLPGAQVWADLWVPSGDPLWSVEPHEIAVMAGEWWARALRPASGAAARAADDLRVHRGASIPTPYSKAVCFGGIGPGEVAWGGRKLVGLAQWRSREGALVHGCAYRRWDPQPLVDILDLPQTTRAAVLRWMRGAAVGYEDDGGRFWGGQDPGKELVDALPDPASWEVVTPTPAAGATGVSGAPTA